jgi:meso-butanediol dehydrogenase / (S,S)-butanediol dehydrogenase / diacetyl reductase
MSTRLHNKVALVTGGAAGIGAAIVRRLVAEGARVLVGDRDQPQGGALCAPLDGRALFQEMDVADMASFAEAIKRVLAVWGRIDILVNNAGIALPAVPVQETSLDQFEQLVDVNLRSVFLGCKLAYPHLKMSSGCVLNISSMSGITGQERHAVYGATKGAINALTKCVAVDWGRDGIRINALCPAGVWTDTLRAWMKVQPDAASIQNYLREIHALGYCPEPEEIATVAAFLCSDEAKFITGCIMPVSGGSECGYNVHAPVALNDIRIVGQQKPTMISRECTLAAIENGQPGRVPVDLGDTPSSGISTKGNS